MGLLTLASRAQIIRDTLARQNWSLHVQATVIPQYHFNFPATYSGDNSLSPSEGTKVSLTNTYYIGRRLWKHAALYINPEVAGGEGLSKTTGVAGFPNGETFRIGSPNPKLYLARLYLEQKFFLTADRATTNEDVNALRETLPSSYIAVRAGRFSLADFFDDNNYSHDPRTDFMNWSLMSAGAWDYPANTRGYTNGIQAEIKLHTWTLRTSAVQVGEVANGNTLDTRLEQAFGTVFEAEKIIALPKKKNFFVIRMGGFYNKSRMGNYREAIDKGISQYAPPDITATRQYGRDKKGFYINTEYDRKNGGFFGRYSWNDGVNETWAFTEIDRSFSAGLSFNGTAWNRKSDKIGLAYVGNGLSGDHRDYLTQHGYGFIIGDGSLHYGIEHIVEAFYSFHPGRLPVFISPDYQFVLHPAYNKDRGPVHIVALRLHVEL